MRVQLKNKDILSIREPTEVESTTWRNYKGETVLHKLIESHDFSQFKAVIEEDKEINRLLGESLINVPDRDGIYPIHIAIQSKDHRFRKFLVENGALLSVRDIEGKNCYHYQILSGHSKLNLPSSPNFILAKHKSNDNKLVIMVVEEFCDESIKALKIKLKEIGLNTGKIYYHKISNKGYKEELDFNLIIGEVDILTDYLFEQYL